MKNASIRRQQWSTPGRAIPIAAAIAIAIGGSAHGATITVNDPTTDSVSVRCTIVDAVAAVNTQTAVNGCIAGDGNNDTIDLTRFTSPTTISFNQPMGLPSRALTLSSTVTIVGSLDPSGTPYVTLERSAAAGTADFGLLSTTAELTITGLTLSNGASDNYGGGAILSGDELFLNNCVVVGNTASSAGGGAIATSAGVTLTHSVVSGNSAQNAGGAIVSNGGVHLYYSTVADNATTAASTFGGGAIYAGGEVYVGHSVISGNTSASQGGGVSANGLIRVLESTITGNTAQAGDGGGLYGMTTPGIEVIASTIDSNTASGNGGGIAAAMLSTTNATVTGNEAGGSGGGFYAASADVTYSTIYANSASVAGGGLDFQTMATAATSIIYGNAPDDVNTTTESPLGGSSNLIGNAPWGAPEDTIDCNPMLGELSNYGGSTDTLPLQVGSCAIDAGPASPAVSVDQRGYPRPAPVGTTPLSDIGAFEAQPQDVIFQNGFES